MVHFLLQSLQEVIKRHKRWVKLTFIFVCYLTFNVSSGFANPSQIDSLSQAIANAPTPEDKLKATCDLATIYLGKDVPKARNLLIDGINDSSLIPDKELLLRTKNLLGVAYKRMGEFEEALLVYEDLYQSALDQENAFFQYAGLLNLGNLLSDKGSPHKAVTYYLEAREVVEETDTMKLMPLYVNIGSTYNQLGDKEIALEYLLKAHFLSMKSNNKLFEAYALHNLAALYIDIKEFDKAVPYLENALKINREVSDNRGIGYNLHNLSEAYLGLRDFEKAKIYAFKELSHRKTLKEPGNIGFALTSLGNIYGELGNYDSAVINYKQALAISSDIGNDQLAIVTHQGLTKSYLALKNRNKSLKHGLLFVDFANRTGQKEDRRDSYFALFEIYKSRNELGDALSAFESYVSLKDSIFSEEKYREIGRLEAGYEAQKREVEQTFLLSQQEEVIKRQRAINIVIIIFLLAILLFGILITRVYIRKNKMHKELQQAMLQLKDLQSQLVHSEKMASLGMFTAGIAHEINNPLNFVQAGVKSLKKRVDKLSNLLKGGSSDSTSSANELFQEMKELIDSAERGTIRTTKIVKDLKLLSSTDEEQFDYVSVHDILRNCLLVLSNRYKGRIEVSEIYSEIPKIEANPAKLTQVFTNILKNAAQAISETGQIIIKTDVEDENCVVIRIKDNGDGIDKEHLNRLYEPFFTTKEVGLGTGLGLSICYGIVQQHNGRITCSSEKGVGTEFEIFLPVRQKNLTYA